MVAKIHNDILNSFVDMMRQKLSRPTLANFGKNEYRENDG